MAKDWTENDIDWAEPATIPVMQSFTGRTELLTDCRAAWGLDEEYGFWDDGSRPLHFCLEGAPGVGKNELVYELARRMRRQPADAPDFYMIAGHEEMSPEDLALLVVPEGQGSFTLRASSLATAIRKGGLFFFDEINRVPERALSPLASVLDDRQEITSAMTNITVSPESERARKTFRFCCALNPSLADSGYVLPDYIEQRTLPVFQVRNPEPEELLKIIGGRLGCDDAWLMAFKEFYERWRDKADAGSVTGEISVRQALGLMAYSLRTHATSGDSPANVLSRVQTHFLRTPDRLDRDGRNRGAGS